MADKLSPLQMTDATSWSGLTTKNHLTAIFGASPQLATTVVRKVMAANYGMTTDTYLSEIGAVKYMETDDDYYWKLIGSSIKQLPLVQARVNGVPITPSTKTGQGLTEFELVFSEFYFHSQQLIGGHKNETYPIRIIADPIKEGTNFVYRCQLLTGDTTLFIPYEELVPGKRFSKDWTPVEQSMSIKGSPTDFSSPYSLRNAFTFIRKEQEFPGNMKGREVKPMGTALKDDKGGVIVIWTRYASLKLNEDLHREKNYALVFATANRAADGTYKNEGLSGYMIVQGAGLRQQKQCANTQYYTKFHIDIPTNMLADLSEGRLTSDQRMFAWKTGERGAIDFHRSLENKTQLYTPNRDTNRIYGISKSMASMGKGYGGQFVEYKAPNNVTVSLEVDSAYDDKVRNKVYDPEGGLVESRRFDMYDVGTREGVQNVQKVLVKGEEYLTGIETGLRDPMSSGYNRVMSTSKDAWKEHVACYISGMINDPSATASLIKEVVE